MADIDSRKLFGKKNYTPGQNLVSAVFGLEKYPFGILEFNYPKVIEILKNALNDEEYDFLKRGFGFGRTVQLQKDIAKDLGVDANYVSKISHDAVEKLKDTTYSKQLLALMPTLDEVNYLVLRGMANEEAKKELGEYRYRLKAAKEATERALSEKDKAEQEVVKAQRELRSAENELKKVNTEKDAAQQRILVLEAKIAKMQSSNDVARKRMRTAYERLEGIIFDTDSGDESANTRAGLEGLGLSDEAFAALKRIGINDLDTLCTMSKHALNKLGVGQKNVEEIGLAMNKKSLSLKS